ncbi:hypothetical protein BW247_06785 [Acidihalobacter ferrooxydans]|uniref:Aminoglycoside phosphotransferase domain-containing protein n=2 Tax=Acidihalobacter ferrooxydans TaxID=1765967 RepID=A0A1P8UGE5_9GAMM|nr:hypothetical protein BW247_06785 [Acidihalobacter ferrooxydans]
MRYLGHLPRHDPVYGYLYDRIFARKLGVYPRQGFRVFAASAADNVYVYEDRQHGRRVLGKYFKRSGRAKSTPNAAHEYQVLKNLQAAGLDRGQHRVVRPLGLTLDFADALFEEFECGEPLYRVWTRTRPGTDDRDMMHALSDLAYLLCRLHNRTAGDETVDFRGEFDYFDKIVARLWRRRRARQDQIDALYSARHRWEQDSQMYADRRVRLHGDATPANFIVGGTHRLTAIDLERSHRGDRAYDVGMVAGELRHWALRQFGDGARAEPYIGHFLWEYARHFPDQSRTFRAVTDRLPFYMGVTLLRIARNSYLSDGYASALVHDALACLRR